MFTLKYSYIIYYLFVGYGLVRNCIEDAMFIKQNPAINNCKITQFTLCAQSSHVMCNPLHLGLKLSVADVNHCHIAALAPIGFVLVVVDHLMHLDAKVYHFPRPVDVSLV